MTAAARTRTHRLRILTLEDRSLPAFLAAPTFPIDGTTANRQPVSIAVADFNRDGTADVVTANQAGNSVSVLLGTGAGGFTPADLYTVGTSPAAVLVLDLDQDGKLDIITADKGGNGVSILRGTGPGTFDAPVSYAAGPAPVALATGDLNRDGRPDLVVANSGTGVKTVTLLLGTAAGTLSAGGTVTVNDNPTSVVVADFNRDGKPDLATVSGGFGHLDVNRNTSSGTGGTPSFAARVNYATGFVANTVVVGDFNRDRQPDLAVACDFPSGDGVSVLLGKPDGTFQRFRKYSAGNQTPRSLAVADLNGDKVQDLVTANDQFANNSVSVLMGRAVGGFEPARVFHSGQAPVGVAVGDFNRDGVQDVVTADLGGNYGTVGLLLGAGGGELKAAEALPVKGPGPAAAADFNGDHRPDLAVVTSYPGYSGVVVFSNLGGGHFGAARPTVGITQPTGVAAADLNRDGKPDLAVATNTGKVVVLLGTGGGRFGARFEYAAGTLPTWVTIDDLNGDGKPDLAVANSGGASVLLGTGTGTFGTASAVNVGGGADHLATGDFNGDGKRDLVASTQDGATVVLGTGTGTFNAPTSYDTGTGPGSVGVGDFNGDGKPDLAASTFISPAGKSAVDVFTNGGGGVFSTAVEYVTDSLPVGVAVADLTGDGKPDVASANQFSDTLTVFPNTGTGSFGTLERYVVGNRPSWVVAADFNGDHQPDLAVVNSNAGTVTVLQSTTRATGFRVPVRPRPTKGSPAAAPPVVPTPPPGGGAPGVPAKTAGTPPRTAAPVRATFRPAALGFRAAPESARASVAARQSLPKVVDPLLDGF